MIKYLALKFLLITTILFSIRVLADEISTLQKVKEDNFLKICTAGGFPPFSIHTKDGWLGFDIDMIKAYSEYLNVKYEIIDYHFDGIIPALNSKKCDMIVSGMTITSDRKKSVHFSEPYFKDGISILFKKSNDEFKKQLHLENLNNENVKIGVRLGYTSDFYVSKKYKNATILKFNETSDLINALRSNKIDIIFTDSNNAKIVFKKFSNEFLYKNTEIQDEFFGVAFRAKDKDFVENYNDFLAKWKESGKYAATLEKHLGY